MSIHSKKIEEKIKDVDFTNPTINRLFNYSNILNEQSDFIKDNGVTDFSLVDSSNGVQITNPFSSQTFL